MGPSCRGFRIILDKSANQIDDGQRLERLDLRRSRFAPAETGANVRIVSFGNSVRYHDAKMPGVTDTEE